MCTIATTASCARLSQTAARTTTPTAVRKPVVGGGSRQEVLGAARIKESEGQYPEARNFQPVYWPWRNFLSGRKHSGVGREEAKEYAGLVIWERDMN